MTDRRRVAPAARTAVEETTALARWLEDAIDAVDLIQIRERDLDAALLVGLVRGVMSQARDSRTRVVVNDRFDVALAAGADGVHLRGDGPAIARIRSFVPEHCVFGRSIHTVDEARTHSDADYLLFGTVFPSQSKPKDWRSQGLDALERVAAESTVPVIAIGGMTVDGAAACRRAGAAGVAAIGLFLSPPVGLGIRAAAEAVRRAFVDQLK